MAVGSVASPGYYFPVCENPRHPRGLGWRAPVSDRQFPIFRSVRGGFRTPVLAIFQFGAETGSTVDRGRFAGEVGERGDRP